MDIDIKKGWTRGHLAKDGSTYFQAEFRYQKVKAMQKVFMLELLDWFHSLEERMFRVELFLWLHQLASADEKRAQEQKEKRDRASPENRTFYESRRISFLWRANFARTIAAAIKLQEVPPSGNWSHFRKRAGEEAPVEQDRPLPSAGAATCEGNPRWNPASYFHVSLIVFSSSPGA